MFLSFGFLLLLLAAMLLLELSSAKRTIPNVEVQMTQNETKERVNEAERWATIEELLDSKPKAAKWSAHSKLSLSGYPASIATRERRRHNIALGPFKKTKKEEPVKPVSAIQVMCEKKKQKKKAC